MCCFNASVKNDQHSQESMMLDCNRKPIPTVVLVLCPHHNATCHYPKPGSLATASLCEPQSRKQLGTFLNVLRQKQVETA